MIDVAFQYHIISSLSILILNDSDEISNLQCYILWLLEIVDIFEKQFLSLVWLKDYNGYDQRHSEEVNLKAAWETSALNNLDKQQYYVSPEKDTCDAAEEFVDVIV